MQEPSARISGAQSSVRDCS
jgi:hypothetical protein